MNIKATRRFVLLGSAGVAAASVAACATAPTVATANAEGAFLPGARELLGPQKGVALLSRNENPYGPSDSALKMVEYAAKKGAYYPGSAMRTLTEMIAERHGLDADQIVVTTGSGEALSAIAVVFGQEGPIVAPRLFWDTTAIYAQRLGMADIQRVSLAKDMSIDIPAIEAAVTSSTGLVQLCNPNNPTGMLSDPAQLKASVRRMSKKATVLVDEAYIELAENPESNSCVELIKEGHDVIVSRTFSKIYGMAGLRVGYTMSSAETAERIRNTSMSWMSGVGIAAAIGSYNDHTFLDYSKSKIVESREMVLDTLNGLGMEALPSSTNFVYFKSGMEANDLQAEMKAKDIWIRGQYMDYNEWSRVSMGKIADVERFCKTLPTVITA